jgi:hypothetical protein
MLKKHTAACLVATIFAAAPALAQVSPPPSGATDRPAATGSGSTATGSSAMQPSTAAPSAGASSTSMGSAAKGQAGMQQGRFMTQIQPGQIMASKLIGTRVVSVNNESVGDINDVIVDRNGQAVAAVVGVGGFLGIGEKSVAIPFNSLEFASRQQASAMSGSNAGGNVATTGSTATGAAPATASGGAVGGNTGTASSSDGDEPERVVLRMTKAELQAAPNFNADRDAPATGTGSTTNVPAEGTTGATGSPGGRPAPQQ